MLRQAVALPAGRQV